MYCVELYVGFQDKTWEIVTIDTPDEEGIEPEVWALAYFNDNFDEKFKNIKKSVAFVGVYHIYYTLYEEKE